MRNPDIGRGSNSANVRRYNERLLLQALVVARSTHRNITILSDDHDAKGSREGGINAMQGHLTRFPKLDAVFTINDPQAVGSDLAAKQLHRKDIVITSVDGAPDIETALKSAPSYRLARARTAGPWRKRR